jgi:toxin ParE1/3/4
VPRIELAPEVFDDFSRFLDHMEQFDVGDRAARIDQIIQAIEILAHSPHIGRPVGGGTRELVIGLRSRGYVALYRFVAPTDTVFILAIRSQREAGYKRPGSRTAARRPGG